MSSDEATTFAKITLDLLRSNTAPEPLENLQNEINTRNVFVVHGRNNNARKAIFSFLNSIGLHPIEWSEAVEATGKPNPYIGEILEVGFSIAQSIIVLFTPDDEARLLADLRNSKESIFETELSLQPRQNVIFEAGMAMGMFPNRTIIVELGELRPMSDISGRHVIRLNNSTQRRQELALRLQAAGCAINLVGVDWHDSGDFETCLDYKK
jgi:predicted nucleotide-binding protein